MRLRVLAVLSALVAVSCVSGNKVRADAEVIKADIERARRTGAMRCAPRELAVAEARREFALDELTRGNSFRAGDEMRLSEESAKKALYLSKDCGPKQILVRENQPPPANPNPTRQQVVIRIEKVDRDNDGVPDDIDKCPDQPGPASNNGCPLEPKVGDRDGDGIPDNVDKCPDQPEDKDGFQDDDGCPELDNDGDGLVDARDRCPNEPGPIENEGCPILDRDGDGVPDNVDKCPDVAGPASNGGCPVLDRDGDGIPDAIDKCPDQAEDKDGFQDEDGCPDPDNDNDGVLDKDDRCPNQPGPATNQGCPVTDRDGDGIPDNVDKCPDEPEDKDGFQDEDGCPELDNDQDGVPDTLDKCPNKPGPAENEGCPVADRDGDGIPDNLDKCPDQPGPKETDGCPKQYKMVVVKKDRIEIKKQIQFKSGSSKIIGSASFELIAEVAQAVRDTPQIKKLRVEGHTDNVGRDSTNLRLSQSRADSVMAALIKAGVDPSRLESVGFGSTKPIESNKTRAGRATNRRTEFNIVDQ